MAEPKTMDSKDTIPFFPDHVRTEFRVVIAIMIVVGVIGGVALFRPVGLGDPADPMNTPAHVKPEWYFLALYQLLKFVPKTTGVVVPILAIILLTIWPFLDRKPDKSPRTARNRLIIITVFMIVLIALTVWGEVS
jgi:quinol-cytochrome oxidoreductase complex cytochrome b subunit